MFKNWIEILLNVLFWLITGWLISIGFSIEGQEITIENGIETIEIFRDQDLLFKLPIVVLISSIFFYINLINVSRIDRKEKRLQILVISLILLVFPVLAYYVIEHQLFIHLMLPHTIVLGIFCFYFTSSVAYAIIKVWQKTEHQKQQLALEKKQTELTLLRAQLHPHFLFNVLNNLLSMVDQKANPALASSLDQLSGLLRYVVYDTQGDVTVRKEIEFIRNFAELQMQRFEKEEIDFDLEVVGDFDLQKIEPGIFIPFIENIFKYGVEPEKTSQIKISFDLTKPNQIIFDASNPIYHALREDKGSGSGIFSTKARLALVYPERHKLTISENENFSVHLELNTDESDNS